MDEPSEQAQDAAPETEIVTAPEPEVAKAEAETPKPEPQPELSPSEAYEQKRQAKRNAPKEAAAEVAPKTEPEAKPTEEAKEEQDEPETVTEEKPREEKKLPNRISIKQFDEADQEAIALLPELRKTDPKASLRDAYEMLDRQKAQRAAEVAEAPNSEPEPDPIAEGEAKLVELKAKKAEMANEEGLYGKELNDIDDQISDQKAALAELRAEKRILAKLAAEQQAQQELSAEEQARSESLKAARSEYPSISDENSELRQVADSLYQQYSNPSHPSHAILLALDAAEIIADRAAKIRANEIVKESGVSYEQALASLRKVEPKTQPPKQAQTAPKPAQPKVSTPSGAARPATPPAPQKPAGYENWSPDQQYQYNRTQKAKGRGLAISF